MTAGRSIAIGLVRAYQLVFSPLKGMFLGSASCCRFSPSCSCYAIEAFRAHGVAKGFWLTTKRLLRCHPWGSSGYDPVPPASSGISSRHEGPVRAHLSPARLK